MDTVVGLVCLYTVLASPHDPLDRISIGDRACYTRRALPPPFTLDIDDFSRTPPLYLLSPPPIHLSLDIYVYVYLILIAAARHRPRFVFGSCVRDCFIAEIPPSSHLISLTFPTLTLLFIMGSPFSDDVRHSVVATSGTPVLALYVAE